MVFRKISTKIGWKDEKKVKICFLGPSIKECGGVQRVTSILANTFAKEHEVSILSVNNSGTFPYYPLDANIKVIDYQLQYQKHILQSAVRGIAKRKNLRLSALLAKYAYYPKSLTQDLLVLLKREAYDCIISSTDYYSLLLAVIAKELTSAKLIAWQHNSFHIYFQTAGKASYTKMRLAKKVLPSLDAVVTLTKADALQYKKYMGLECHYIYNPLSFFSEKKSDASQKVLLFVSRLEIQQKGLDLLIDIAEELFHKRGYHGWKLQIVGSGPGLEQTKKWVEQYELEPQVEFLGEQKDVAKFYCEASIFLSTSRWEGFGLVVVEAMECGLPVVSFQTDGPSEIIEHGKNGYLVENQDVCAFADALEILMKQEELRKTFSQNARIRARDFYPERIVEQWENLIKKG